MDRIREKQRLLFYNRDRRSKNKPNIADNSLVPTHTQSIESNLPESTTDEDKVCIVWLTNKTMNTIELPDTIPSKILYSIDDCVVFIAGLKTTDVFLIIDYVFVSDILSFIDDFSQIVFVYTLATEQNSVGPLLTNAQRLIRRFSKNMDELLQLIMKDIDTCVKDSICMDLMDLTEIEESTSQTRHTSIVWYDKLVECLSALNFTDANAKADLIEYCRQQYPINDEKNYKRNIEKQNEITQFENEYSSENAIQYYTRDSFLFRLLNKTLRTRELRQIFQFRYFINDFQKQLELHFNRENILRHETVYRGQQITQLELMKLKKCIKKYISINTYLSTSCDVEVAQTFAGDGEMGILSVILEIDIRDARNINDKRRVPVFVGHVSQFNNESEIIFPISSTFFVTSIELMDKRWHMKLKLTDDSEHKELIDSAQDDTIEQLPLNIQFIEVYLASNDLLKGEQYVKSVIENSTLLSESMNMAYIYNTMGEARSKRDYIEHALDHFKKALDYIPLGNKYHAKIYENMAKEYINMSEHKTARKYLDQALVYEKQLNPFELASLYETFSMLYLNMQNFDKAIASINQALDIYRVHRATPNHLILAIFYLALIHKAKGDFKRALLCAKHALNIAFKYTSKDDSSLIILYATIGFLYYQLNDFSLAMTYLQRSIKFIRLDTTPGISITIYHTLADICIKNADIEQGRDYAQKAFDIYNQNQHLSPNVYNTILPLHFIWAKVNHDLSNYNVAVDSFIKVEKMTESPADLMLIYFEMGQIYFKKSEMNIALRYFNDALRLLFQTGQSYLYSALIPKICHYIFQVYKVENNFEKAIFYIKLALKLQLISENKNFELIIYYYSDLIELCPKQAKEYIEKIQEISNNASLSPGDKIFCQDILGKYYKEQQNLTQALIHYELSLAYTLACNIILYAPLIGTYNNLAKLHCEINTGYPDSALFYYEKIHEIYFKLRSIEKLPIIDRKSLCSVEKSFLRDFNQSSTLNLCVMGAYYGLIDGYIHKKKFIQAIKYLQISERLVDEYIGNKQKGLFGLSYETIGLKYHLLNMNYKAIHCFEKRLQYPLDDDNQYGYTYYLIADCYKSENNLEMALSKYKISLTFLHNSQLIDYEKLSLYYSNIGFIYQKRNNHEYAAKYFEQALLYDLKSQSIDFNQHVSKKMMYVGCLMVLKPWDFYQQLKYALQGLQLADSLNHIILVPFYQQIAVLYLKNEMFHDALIYLDKVLQYCTESDVIFQVLEGKIHVFCSMGNYDSALEIIRNKIKIHFTFKEIDHIQISSAYITRAGIYRQLGKYKLAIKYFQFALTILQIYKESPNHIDYADIYDGLALIYLECGQTNDARKYCSKARAIRFSQKNKTYDPIVNSITLGLIECQSENYYNALDYFGQAWASIFNGLSLSHSKYLLYNHIGYVYFQLGQADQAMQFYMKSLSLYNEHNCNKHPDIAQIYRNIGLFHEQIEQNYPLALSYYKRALELVPNKKHPHYTRYENIIATLKLKIRKEDHSSKNTCFLF